MRQCSKCNEIKNLSDYYAAPGKKDGLRSSCKECDKKVASNNKNKVTNDAKYRQKHLDQIRKKDTIRNKVYRDQNPEKRQRSKAVWIENNPLLNKQIKKQWRLKNRPKINELASKRRANKLNATPKWLTESEKLEISKIYETCPSGYHVDHISPLKGRNSCGLHVPWNLQHLPAEANLKKSNKVV